MLNQLFDLSGRTALVTGGSKGIGKSIARGYAEAGANVVITARHEDELQAACAEIGDGLDVKVVYRLCEMTDRAQCDDMIRSVQAEFPIIDILCNNAGSNAPQPLVDIHDEDWDRVLELNFTSYMRLARGFAPAMIEQKWGRILHMSSIMALTSAAGRGIYSGTKAALVGTTRAHAIELGPHGVTVNCLAPGPIATDMLTTMLTPEQRAVFSDRASLKRLGETTEMVGPALLLSSDAGSYITGSVLVVDGGVICRSF